MQLRILNSGKSLRAYIFSICLAVTIVFIFAITIRDIWLQRKIAALHADDLRASRSVGSIMQMDEVLTMSAKMAAATGDLAYEERYRFFEPKLDAAIKELASIYEASPLKVFPASIDEANQRLVELENKSFDLVRAGERSTALALLGSDQYANYKGQYAKAVNVVSEDLKGAHEKERSLTVKLRIRQATVFSLGMIVLMIMWVMVIRSLSRSARLEVDLKAERDNLENAVEERTANIASLTRQIEYILGATKTGLDIIDSDYNVVYIDSEWQKVYGDPKGRKCYDYFMGKGEVCPGCGVKKAFETKEVVITEEILAKEGNRPIQVTTIPFQDKTGNWLVAEVNVDITERKRIENELKEHHDNLKRLVEEKMGEVAESEAKFKTIFGESTDGLVVADPDTRRFAMCNKSFSTMLGYSEEEMLKLGVDEIHPENDLPHVLEQFRRQASGEIRVAESLSVKRKDGSIFFADVVVSHLYLSGKRFLLGCFRDITERKRAEDALIESEASYRAIFDSANDAIIVRDTDDYRIIDANRRAGEMFCSSRDELRSTPLEKMLTDSPEYSAGKLRAYYEKAREGEPQLFEWLVKDMAGRQFWVEISIRQAVIRGGFRFLSIVRDITERKRTMEMKNDFMNMVSHELRTPLGVIKEGISLVLEGSAGKVGDKQKELLDVSKDNVDRLARLINQVLDFQKLDAGRMEFKLEENDINDLVSELHRQTISLATRHRLKYYIELDGSVPKTRFDRDKLFEVLMNLFNNALKHTDKGSIALATRREGDHVLVSVSDTGSGIKKADMAKLFQRFSQIGRKPGGTGLGLAIAKEIIDVHKGKIWAESVEGKGTTFYFTIPI